ncbi:MAG: acyl-CoA dehydratase activase [Desulfobacterales bacterium]|jgi:predicted CoA-substrate-specific enzyme activase|nr:acyl-CoA dehydratase activase [Desulfobacterales bacterium]
MSSTRGLLGVDIGSVSVCLVEITPEKDIVYRAYAPHHGDVKGTIRDKILAGRDLSSVCGIAVTSSTPDIIRCTRTVDNRVSMISAARHFYLHFGSILFVGGEKFGILLFDADGRYRKLMTNTGCAAGTGSFLDQQAERLVLSNTEALSRMALSNKGPVPGIATRCAVFAKTDLAHAQQMGFSLPAICDGLCRGLAKNIVDTLEIHEDTPDPILFTGGVSLNEAVVNHIKAITRKEVITADTLFYGAFGAALNLLSEKDAAEPMRLHAVDELFLPSQTRRVYAYRPLKLFLSSYPDFFSKDAYEYVHEKDGSRLTVAVDRYSRPPVGEGVYLGIDIGSTSTKAVLMDKHKTVLTGFYTRTAGAPIRATQALFAAIRHMAASSGASFNLLAAGTTGAGRKFIGKLIGADLVVDEITAHALAAVELDANVDTLIEIGGQDAKFTLLENGQVTFSAMNNVCAAGTGSFIEEQAKRLGCPLADFSAAAENVAAPLASDRCTVFMERDINQYLAEGYAVNELLAATLHSVRDNYLTKVAVERRIGKNIVFQGATAKNRALVAAFEQRLEKPIRVSRYCHLTGAMGVALMLSAQPVTQSGFKGLQLSELDIPVRSEVCEYCTNHCKITVAQVDGATVAYGFLCGRDYDTGNYVSNNRSGYDLLKDRKKTFSLPSQPKAKEGITIGIPAVLHLVADMPLWEHFFHSLNIRTLTSEPLATGLRDGKRLAGAEFCAPMTAMHGHVDWLLKKADYVFMPVYLEQKAEQKGLRRQYCYYTQFSTALAASCGTATDGKRLLTPMVHYLYSSFFTKAELYRMLKAVSNRSISFLEVSAAYEKARAFMAACRSELKAAYQSMAGAAQEEWHAVLLGRPYMVLSKTMNKGIPDLFAALGVKAVYQDMLSVTDADVTSIAPLLQEIHWHYAAEILAAAEVTAKTPGAYPVLVTAFGCSPDAFVIDYFKEIMSAHRKPYLILQLDEHDSRVGYETRIEAACRSFHHHHALHGSNACQTALPAPDLRDVKDSHDKTLLIPNWDPLSCPLIAANLRRAGLDARCLEESASTIRNSLKHNTGQCLPLNIIAQNFADYIETHDLDPGRTMLWLPVGQIACNLRLYPHHIKTLLNSYGHGMERAEVCVGRLSMIDIALFLPMNNYFAYMFGGYIRKMGCNIRPFETTVGETDRVIADAVSLLTEAFLKDDSKEAVISNLVSRFEKIGTTHSAASNQRPKVAIFGDLYVRDNPVINQNLIHFIEAHGGEVITLPYSEYLKMISKLYYRKWFIEGHFWDAFASSVWMASLRRKEKIYYLYFERILNEPEPVYDESAEEILSRYNMRIEHTGETMDNILKVHYLLKQYPDIALFVHASPSFCCPGLITEAMAGKIERLTGVPVVSITYDGSGGNKNEAIIPYLTYAAQGSRRESNRTPVPVPTEKSVFRH